MGEQKLRFKNSQQTTDEGSEDDVPVEVVQAYECVRQPCDLQLAKGTTVRLLDMKNEILVFRGTQPIGYASLVRMMPCAPIWGWRSEKGAASAPSLSGSPTAHLASSCR